jgi:uncharacterized phage protein gp47/JayE
MTLADGLGHKQFSEIKAEIEESLVNTLGEINLLAPSIFATIVGIFAEREANLWEQIAAVYNSAYPYTAEGYSLDGICALNGIVRSNSTYSKVTCQLTAVPYTKIPKNSIAVVKNTRNYFALSNDVIVTNENCYSIKIEVKNNSYPSYELTINKQLFKFVKAKGETIEDIVSNLVSLVNEAELDILASCNGSEIILKGADLKNVFSCFVSEGMIILECTNNALMVATLKGAIAAPKNSLNNIHTPISGWIACNNALAAKIGNNRESDPALRARRAQSIKLGGSGTIEAIRASLLNLNTVSAVSISENTTTGVSETGLPPHSFEALITGGEDLDIAHILWQKKPAGIKTHGKISVAIPDSENKTQVVNFSRPTIRFIYGRITITKTKDFKDGAITSIKSKLVSQINNLGVGSNVILKSLYLSIFSEQGIANAYIELGSSAEETSLPNLNEADVVIKAAEVALTDSLKIELVLKDF